MVDRNTYYKWRRRFEIGGFYALLFAIVLAFIFPLFWMFSTAFRPESEMFVRELQLIPETFTLENWELVLDSSVPQYFINSVIVSGGVVFLTTTLATLGGYGLSRLEFPFKRNLTRAILIGYMFPPILLGIPMFIIWRDLGILNSYLGLILALTALSLPFSVWMLWKFFQAVPKSMEESAHMMGATRFGAFYDVALALAKPGIIAIAVFSYAIAWNAYTIPKIIVPDSSKWVLTVGLHSFIEGDLINWGEIMAGSALAVIPAFLFVYFLQKYLLEGFRTLGY